MTAKIKVPQLDGRIVGGKSTTIDQYPYQISVQIDGVHKCGGSLIASKYVLTAAHCTNGKTVSSLSIRAGSSYHSSGGQLVAVSDIHQHTSYNSDTQDYDVSVLNLSEAVTAENARIISLVDSGSSLPVGEYATVTGWGLLSEGGSQPTQLQVLDVPVLSQTVCENAYVDDDITNRMFCAGYLNGGKDACQGDSGGPLMYNGQLIGVVSWGFGCARPNYPGVYASVSELRSFINSILE